jgi:hypothetical protein
MHDAHNNREAGIVLEGRLPFTKRQVDMTKLKLPRRTRISLILGNPDEARRCLFPHPSSRLPEKVNATRTRRRSRCPPCRCTAWAWRAWSSSSRASACTRRCVPLAAAPPATRASLCRITCASWRVSASLFTRALACARAGVP